MLGHSKLTATLSGNITRTEVSQINVPGSVADKFTAGNLEAVRNTLFNREERNRLEDALPRTKGTFSIRYEPGAFSIIGRANFYGSIEYKPQNKANDETFGAKTLLDLDLSYQVVSGIRFSVGANNLLNTFPDAHRKAANLSFGRFIYSRRVTQFGMNGGYYYTRLFLNL